MVLLGYAEYFTAALVKAHQSRTLVVSPGALLNHEFPYSELSDFQC